MRLKPRGIGSIIVLSLITVVLTASARGADPVHAGDATFTPPQRWAVKTQDDGLVRMVSPDENVMIIVMPGNPYAGELQDAFDKTWAGLKRGLKADEVLKGGEPQSGETEGGYESVTTDATLRDENGNTLQCRYTLLRNGDAMCGLAYVGTPKAFKQFDPTYDDFAGGFDLGGRRAKRPDNSAPAAPRKPARADNNPDAENDAKQGDEPAVGAKKGKPAPKPPELEPGTVAGRITDARGNIIEDARLLVQVSGTTLAGQRTSFDIEVDDNGLFSQEVPDGLWRIYGFIEKEYKGHKYRLPLDPEDKREIGSTQGTKKGVVKNFVWRVAGLKPKADKTLPGSYYGGSIDLSDPRQYDEAQRLATRHPAAKVFVVLLPRGPLLDGSKGRPLDMSADVGALAGFSKPIFPDIPLGEYDVAATLVEPGGKSVRLNVAVGFVPANALRPSGPAAVSFLPPSAFESVKTVSLSVWE